MSIATICCPQATLTLSFGKFLACRASQFSSVGRKHAPCHIGYEFSQFATSHTIDLYHDRKFLSGNKYGLGRERPFYNVTKFHTLRPTTDLDTQDVRIESDEPGAYIVSFEERKVAQQDLALSFLQITRLQGEP